MVLDQPIHRSLAAARRVLLAGCGGGYDVLGAVPLLVELRARGVEVHLASLSFARLDGVERSRRHHEVTNLHHVDASHASEVHYSPEAWLAHFLDGRLGGHHVVHCFEKTGVQPLAAAYRQLVSELALDAVVLVDGGIDAVLRGDERSIGTPAEDLTSLGAVAQLEEVPARILACVGLGAELRDGICHADVLERVAVMTARGAFLGTSAVLPGTGCGDLYLDALTHLAHHQRFLKQSHVHACIAAACRGEFGDRGAHVWLSPLLTMFWFFDAAAVAADHAFLPSLAGTETIGEVVVRVEAARKGLAIRGASTIPL